MIQIHGKPESIASIIKRKLAEEEQIDLYPKTELSESAKINNAYAEAMEKRYSYKKDRDKYLKFCEDVKTNLLVNGIYYSILEPVLNEDYATTREKEIGYNTVEKFVNEEGTINLLDRFSETSIYLAEIADNVETYYKIITEGAMDKLKEGLSEKDAYDIEDKDISKFIIDSKKVIPMDISRIIRKRVDDAVEDFIDDKRKDKFALMQVYNKAKGKIQDYDNAEQNLTDPQTDADTDGMDADVSNDANLNAKTDNQQNQDAAQYAQDQIDNSNYQEAAKLEAVRQYNKAQNEVLSRSYSVFDAMARAMTESVHKVNILKEAYTGSNGKIDFKKLIDDTKVAYSFMECANTLRMVNIDESYIKNMIGEFKS